MTALPLVPAPAREPRWCRYCGRPIPVGPVIGGAGSGCARKHGITPPRTPPRIRRPRQSPRQPRQDGPDLLDLLAALVRAAEMLHECGTAATLDGMAEPQQTDDTVRARIEAATQVTPEGKARARARLAQADAALTPDQRQAARDRYAQYTRPA